MTFFVLATRHYPDVIPSPTGNGRSYRNAVSAVALKVLLDLGRQQCGNIKASYSERDSPSTGGFAIRKHNHGKPIVNESPNKRRKTRQTPAVRNLFCALGLVVSSVRRGGVKRTRHKISRRRCLPNVIGLFPSTIDGLAESRLTPEQ